jgi:cyclic pyranopterin phosphate synthase
MNDDLTHFDAAGHARMVDVSDKAETRRVATAAGRVVMAPETLSRIMTGAIGKGDVLAVARLAGIMATKRTGDLIPLCHPLPVTGVAVDLVCNEATHSVDITATVHITSRTGVEMEALTAVSVAGLTVYDMCKAIDRGMQLSDVRLLRKEGGRSGSWHTPDAPNQPKAQ